MGEDCLAIVIDCLGRLSIPLGADRQRQLIHLLRSGDPSARPADCFGLDSLALVEFCIFLELEHGIPLVPTDLIELPSLLELERQLRQGLMSTRP